MTLKTYPDRPGTVRLVDCPFCETDLSGETPTAQHLRQCDPFHEEWGPDG